MQNKKIFHNAKWIVVCRIAQSLIQVVVGMLTARYMGPSNYGLIHYASSVVAFFVPLMQLGLQSTLVQEYIENQEHSGRILGTSLVMNLVSAVACMIGVTVFSLVANHGDRTAVLVCALYSVCLFFQAFEMLQYWFQAQLLSKYSSSAMLLAYVVTSAYKIYLLASGKSVYWFALSHAVEYAAAGVFMLLAYRKNTKQKISVSLETGKKLFTKSKPYIPATLMEIVYNSTGGIFLTLMHGETENGYYAAAVTCTCITGFIFRAIFDTARPVILESKKVSQLDFEKNVSRVYSLTIWAAAAQSVMYTLCASLIVRVLYGETYLPAIPVLQIMIWYTIFSYIAYVRNIWILAEEKHKYLFPINLCGAVVNVMTNVLLVPVMGAAGAALAMVITVVFTNFIMGFILKPMRQNNRLLLRGMNPRLITEMLFAFKT
ncbi:MAG: flippase [Oscillospiraceae bacterium]|nr:flippase [Oscillospiraceae bacterium]